MQLMKNHVQNADDQAQKVITTTKETSVIKETLPSNGYTSGNHLPIGTKVQEEVKKVTTKIE